MAKSRGLHISDDQTIRSQFIKDNWADPYNPNRIPKGSPPVLGVENIEQISYTPIRCRIDANVTVTGETGNTYVFNGGGSVVEVAEADVPKLLGMKLGGALCCGDATFNIMFEKVA